MDSLSKKLQNLGIHDIRNAARFAQNVIVQYEPYQIDIRRATNTDSWGPTPKHLAKVLRNRYQVPMYLMTEYILKRLIDHIAQRPKNLYEKARKQYVNYGSEWRVVLKCLVVLEFLLLNVDDGDELNQIKSCLNAHKHILTREVNNYKIKFSNDGKMEVHERGIKKKNELILQYLDDPHFLKRERLKNKKNSLKIKNNNAAGGYNNDLSDVTSSHRRYNHPSFSGDHVMDAAHGMGYDFDDDDDDDFDDYVTSRSNKHTDLDDFDDEFNEFTVGTTQTSSGRATSSSSSSSSATPNHNVNTHNRRSQITSLEDQRRQRREIFRERIRSTERQRKTREQMKLQQQQQQQDIPDLLDLDFDSTPATNTNNNNDNNSNLTGAPISGTTNLNVFSSNEDKNHSKDDDDDGFGDFQSEPSTTPMSNNNISSNLNDLLTGNNINITTSNNNNNNNNNNKTTSLNDKDLFADLFNNSKSLI